MHYVKWNRFLKPHIGHGKKENVEVEVPGMMVTVDWRFMPFQAQGHWL